MEGLFGGVVGGDDQTMISPNMDIVVFLGWFEGCKLLEDVDVVALQEKVVTGEEENGTREGSGRLKYLTFNPPKGPARHLTAPLLFQPPSSYEYYMRGTTPTDLQAVSSLRCSATRYGELWILQLQAGIRPCTGVRG